MKTVTLLSIYPNMSYDISDQFNNYEQNQRLKIYTQKQFLGSVGQIYYPVIIGNPNDISYIFYFLDATTYVELYA